MNFIVPRTTRFLINVPPILKADYRDTKAVKEILRDGAEVNVCNAAGNNALHLAVFMHRAEHSCLGSIYLLLHAGINVNLVNNRGVTALDRAVRSSSVDVVEALLQNGAEVNREDCDYSVLTVAACAQDETIFKLLLDRGANVDFQNVDRSSPMNSIGWLTDELTMLAVIERTTNINRRSDQGTPLCSAALHGNATFTKLLLDAGADFTITQHRMTRFTPLHMAVYHNAEGTRDVVKALLKKGASVDERDVLDVTPLLHALDKCDITVIKLLSDHGADFTAKDREGNSVLHRAATNPRGEVISFVLDKGADVNIKNRSGKTALHIVARYGTPEICNILLDKSDVIWCKDNNGKSPLLAHVEERDWYLQNAEMPPTELGLVGLALIAYIAKLEHLNFVIDQEDHQLIKLDPGLNKHYEACNRELEKMECQNVYNCLSLFDILFANKTKMPAFARNEDLVTSLNNLAPDLCEDLHIYFSSMQIKFQHEVWKQRLMKKAQKIISEIMGLNDPSHYICEKIVSYLEEEDLKKY